MKRLLACIIIIFALGCAKKQVVQPEKPLEEEEIVTEEVKVEKVPAPVVEEVAPPPEEIAKVEEEVPPLPEKPPFEFRDVLFDFDKYDIRPDAREILDSTAEWLNENKHINILIEGHCDERGTNEYNLALGDRRAKSTRDYLVSKGVAPLRIQTVSYGEERPLCTEHNEDCWQKNRRAHFVVIK
jgi:peptidoglycan-associated lipoprotein